MGGEYFQGVEVGDEIEGQIAQYNGSMDGSRWKPLGAPPEGRTKEKKKVGGFSKTGNEPTTQSEKNADMKACSAFPRTREQWTWEEQGKRIKTNNTLLYR